MWLAVSRGCGSAVIAVCVRFRREFGLEFRGSLFVLDFLNYSGFIAETKAFYLLSLVCLYDGGVGLLLKTIPKGLAHSVVSVHSHMENEFSDTLDTSSVLICPCISFFKMSAGAWHFDSVPVDSYLFRSSGRDPVPTR